MGRPPKNPEGARISVTIRLPEKHLTVLDESSARQQVSRSDTVIKLIESTKQWRDQPPTEQETP